MSHYPGKRYQACYSLICVFVLFAVTACSVTPEKLTGVPEIKVALSFQAQWWSENQMEGLDLDNPPDKKSRIELENWETSDPVSTPHPQSFDVVATIETSIDATNLSLKTLQRWGIGALSDGKPTRWTPWESIDSPAAIATSASRTQTTTLTRVDLDSLQQRLYEQGEWPWMYAVRVEVSGRHGTEYLQAQTSKQLSILASD